MAKSRRGIRVGNIVVVLMGLTTAGVALAADTLVIKNGATFGPALAKSWSSADGTVTFQLADGVDGAHVAQVLVERLPAAKVAFAGGVLTVTGVAPQALLEALTTINVAAEDPLAGVGGLGNLGASGTALASSATEGGGSIRASRPTEFAFPTGDAPQGPAQAPAKPYVFQEHDPHERFEADVLEVRRGAYPLVVLKLRVRRACDAGPLRREIHKGRVVEGSVLYSGAALDLTDPANRRNLAAFYLAPGDHILVHALSLPAVEGRLQFDKVNLDWLERQEAK